MKTGNSHFLQLSRDIFTDEYAGLSNGSKWLFVILNELEQRFCSGNGESNRNFFFYSDEQLAEFSGLSLKTIKKYKAELRHYPQLVQISYGHWNDKKTGKKSEKKVTCYRILR